MRQEEEVVRESSGQFGEMIANVAAILLLLGLLAIIFFISAKPIFPERMARMVIILPVDAIETAAVKNTRLDLPPNFNLGLVRPRPGS